MLKFLKTYGLSLLAFIFMFSPIVTIPILWAASPLGIVENILASIGLFISGSVFACAAYGIQYLIDLKTGKLNSNKKTPLTTEDIEQLEAIAAMQKEKNLAKLNKQAKKKGLLHKATKKMEASAFESKTDSNTQDLGL